VLLFILVFGNIEQPLPPDITLPLPARIKYASGGPKKKSSAGVLSISPHGNL
jgi:hypothetical protein